MKTKLVGLAFMIFLSACGQAKGASTGEADSNPIAVEDSSKLNVLSERSYTLIEIFKSLSQVGSAAQTSSKLAKKLDLTYQINCKQTCKVEKR